ncbi:unnamed protein product [Amoebophrya sp. A25]|nr:unnamed protein product [Amoebophrya sp. A25]|eukprot:GSA25T00020795001.1
MAVSIPVIAGVLAMLLSTVFLFLYLHVSRLVQHQGKRTSSKEQDDDDQVQLKEDYYYSTSAFESSTLARLREAEKLEASLASFGASSSLIATAMGTAASSPGGTPGTTSKPAGGGAAPTSRTGSKSMFSRTKQGSSMFGSKMNKGSTTRNFSTSILGAGSASSTPTTVAGSSPSVGEGDSQAEVLQHHVLTSAQEKRMRTAMRGSLSMKSSAAPTPVDSKNPSASTTPTELRGAGVFNQQKMLNYASSRSNSTTLEELPEEVQELYAGTTSGQGQQHRNSYNTGGGLRSARNSTEIELVLVDNLPSPIETEPSPVLPRPVTELLSERDGGEQDPFYNVNNHEQEDYSTDEDHGTTKEDYNFYNTTAPGRKTTAAFTPSSSQGDDLRKSFMDSRKGSLASTAVSSGTGLVSSSASSSSALTPTTLQDPGTSIMSGNPTSKTNHFSSGQGGPASSSKMLDRISEASVSTNTRGSSASVSSMRSSHVSSRVSQDSQLRFRGARSAGSQQGEIALGQEEEAARRATIAAIEEEDEDSEQEREAGGHDGGNMEFPTNKSSRIAYDSTTMLGGEGHATLLEDFDMTATDFVQDAPRPAKRLTWREDKNVLAAEAFVKVRAEGLFGQLKEQYPIAAKDRCDEEVAVVLKNLQTLVSDIAGDKCGRQRVSKQTIIGNAVMAADALEAVRSCSTAKWASPATQKVAEQLLSSLVTIVFCF